MSRAEYIIYTTGIDNWGHPAIINFWKHSMLPHILDLLGKTRSQVSIVHYDPLMETPPQHKAAQAKRDSELLAPDTFFAEPLPLYAIDQDELHYDSHLIIDFAHLFYYDIEGIPVLVEGSQAGDQLRTDYPRLKVVYPGYVGEGNENQKHRDLAMSLYFLLPAKNNYITYIDLIANRIGLDTIDGLTAYPFETVAAAVNEAKKSIILEWRHLKGPAGPKYDDFIRDTLTIDVVMSILYSSSTREEFVDIVIQHALKSLN